MCITKNERNPDLSPGGKLSIGPVILPSVLFDRLTIWLSWQSHVEGGKLAQVAGVADINVGCALKSTSSKSHHST
jgi:hypothetical protein